MFKMFVEKPVMTLAEIRGNYKNSAYIILNKDKHTEELGKAAGELYVVADNTPEDLREYYDTIFKLKESGEDKILTGNTFPLPGFMCG